MPAPKMAKNERVRKKWISRKIGTASATIGPLRA